MPELSDVSGNNYISIWSNSSLNAHATVVLFQNISYRDIMPVMRRFSTELGTRGWYTFFKIFLSLNEKLVILLKACTINFGNMEEYLPAKSYQCGICLPLKLTNEQSPIGTFK